MPSATRPARARGMSGLSRSRSCEQSSSPPSRGDDRISMMDLLRPALGLAPVLCFLGALVLLDSYKLVRLRSVVAAVVAGMLVAGIAYLVNGWLLQWFEFHAYTRYVSPLLEEALKALIIVA